MLYRLLLTALPFLMKTPSGYPELQLPRQGKFRTDDKGNLMSVPAIMNYIDRHTCLAQVKRDREGNDKEMDGDWNSEAVNVKNARPLGIKLHRNGFQLREDPIGEEHIDFFDTNDVIDRYYPRCEALLEEILGPGVQVKAFDHNIRLADENLQNKKLENAGGSTTQKPLGFVHGDYTRVSAPRRLLHLAQPPKANDVMRHRLKEHASLLEPHVVEQALEGRRRFALVNVWRSIDPNHPVKSHPLACIDASTVTLMDLRTLQIHYADRTGENYLACPSESHQWMFFPEMTIDEVLLVKQWDSAGGLAKGQDQDGPCSTFSLHSAFLTPPDPAAAPRQSMEVRCVCLWDQQQYES